MAETPARGRRPDLILLFIVLTLIAFGTVMIYSSSYMLALQKYGDGYFFLKKHLLFLVIGIAAMIALMRTPYPWLRGAAYAGMGVSLVLLAAIFLPGIGVTKGGARRWLNLGFFTFQAAELVKLLVVVFLAHYLTRKSAHIQEFRKGFLLPLAVVMVPVALVVRQPDFGSAVLIVAVSVSVLYIAGTRVRYLAGSMLVLVPAAATLVMMKGYRMDRWNTFLDPWKDPQHKGFQIIQSFLSFGSGGPFGVGLGDGMQKLFYLPEPHTDFILSIIAEESGFIGICTVIVLFGLLIFRGFVIAFRVQDGFGSLLASGITILLALEAFINIAGVMGLIPTKGMALPFLSYGGTSLIVSCMAVGILLNLSTYQKSTPRGTGL
ncbi:MAG TPA: putative lipid II flippase FtsW [Syntrophales bacterium]|nr:putative lipid II flippase FtsW [Syntrophales bacterium]